MALHFQKQMSHTVGDTLTSPLPGAGEVDDARGHAPAPKMGEEMAMRSPSGEKTDTWQSWLSST